MVKQMVISCILVVLLIQRFGRAVLLTNKKYAASIIQDINNLDIMALKMEKLSDDFDIVADLEELKDSYDKFMGPEVEPLYDENQLQMNGSEQVEVWDNDWVLSSFNSFPLSQDIQSAGGMTVKTSTTENQVVFDGKRELLQFVFRAVIPVYDDRVIVQNSLDMPFRSIGKIGKGCTGTVIGSRHILTSAHCVFDFVNERAFPDLNYQPALNIAQSPKYPYPVYDWLYAFYPDQFANGRNVKFDYAVIILKDPLPQNITPIAFGNDCVQQKAYNLNIAGYPLEKEPKDAMWTTSCVNIKINCTQLYFSHTCDTTTGMSGSGMITATKYSNGDTHFTVRGVHQGYKRSIRKNVAIYINKQVEQQIKDFIFVFP